MRRSGKVGGPVGESLFDFFSNQGYLVLHYLPHGCKSNGCVPVNQAIACQVHFFEWNLRKPQRRIGEDSQELLRCLAEEFDIANDSVLRHRISSELLEAH